ncbi:zinc-dependent alcohol dehydrogenase [Leptolyngbya sp. FACHB-711]|uniref:zinc-dependent alcohol dehydrogenase n=1 Tax=unclassified Leptolyngbya TaxID=2650499 RepID=UPI001689DD12|nr:zinc-dependent alcohol dehydrogenase [Leptolyngbya sp. FACHB-711]MBD1849886.1 glutathione-dependent formaldehyde dehydrogenase [Cyanobacteria bacterium FACHB-502]MBD2023648.1 glutathione-dependent formaldehyde dehydrogenase [Leptolyngbya sp. FACHB-711]
MKAVCWHGPLDIRVDNVPDPKILNPRDAIVKITSTAICGSDLHFYDGFIPSMMPGDIVGHEFMGEIVEVGPAVKNLKIGDRVIIPFPISCGNCFFCRKDLWSLCDNSNHQAHLIEPLYGTSPAALFGYSHFFGGYAGGQAEYARVPFADVGPYKVPDHLTDDQVLFLTDILPTGYMGAENCNIQPGDTVAVWGCGPVGMFGIKSAFLLGAERVIAIDRVPERLELAKQWGAEVINYEEIDPGEALKEMTGGRGPDSCMDAVGLEAHGMGPEGVYDKVKQAVRMETDRPYVLRQAIVACRKGGTVSLPGVYGGFVDKIPMGAAMNKGLTFKMGQTHVHKYLDRLLAHIENGDIDPTFVISHHLPLDDAPRGYEIFKHKRENCTKVVLKP